MGPPRGKKDFYNVFGFGLRLNRPFDKNGPEKKLAVCLVDSGTFSAVSQNPIMGGF